jgi:tRNA A-37 threonylcarbamoyl transferase component Bud32
MVVSLIIQVDAVHVDVEKTYDSIKRGTVQPDFIFTQHVGDYRPEIDGILVYVCAGQEYEPTFLQMFLEKYHEKGCIICTYGINFDMYTMNFCTEIPTTSINVEHFIPLSYFGTLYDSSWIDSHDCTAKDIVSADIIRRFASFQKDIQVHPLQTYIRKKKMSYEDKCDFLKNAATIAEKNGFSFACKANSMQYITELQKIRYAYDSATGTDVKILQYTEKGNDPSKFIDMVKLLGNAEYSAVFINLEKDTVRYRSAMDGIKCLGLEKAYHLKGTYWKDAEGLIMDLNAVLKFIGKHNSAINHSINLNDFAEVDDANICINGGPLACYTSHLRAMIYGYTNNDDDALTIIMEDDFIITDIEKIRRYLPLIPADFDIICLNSYPLNKNYGEQPYYRFDDVFHSLHFYIIKNACMPKIFAEMYPITTQVDILIARLYGKLKIYNIPDTVYQRNFETNTQNNLHIILNDPGYSNIRTLMKNIGDLLYDKIGNRHISESVIENVLYDFIIHHTITSCTETKPAVSLVENNLYEALFLILSSCVRGIDTHKTVLQLMQNINDIITSFQSITGYLPLAFGSVSNVYVSEDAQTVKKVFNQRFRWYSGMHPEHTDAHTVCRHEVDVMKTIMAGGCMDMCVPRLISYTEDSIIMSNQGVSLYDSFSLPDNWQEQICFIFAQLDKCGVSYPEFNIKNILLLDGKLSFIDFGLAKICGDSNRRNCDAFIDILTTLMERFKTCKERMKELYITYMENMRVQRKYPLNIF